MPESPERKWIFYIDDMIDFCKKVQSYTANIDIDAFVKDQKTYDATLRNLELIGEAATHIPNELKSNQTFPGGN